MARIPRYILAALAIAFVVTPASGGAAQAAGERDDPSGLCLTAIAVAEHRYDVPHGLLAVMAKVESGRPAPPSGAVQPWPWTVDADGQGVFFPNKDEAVAWSRQALDSGTVTYLDVGCMQVDLRSHPNAFANLEQAFDPVANVDYGARFLTQLHDGVAAGNWFVAVGFYHSQTPVFAAEYRAQVAAIAAGLPPPRITGGHLSMVRLDLVGGGTLRINEHRQPARLHRQLSSCQIASILGSYLPRRVAGCGAPRHG